MIDFLRDTIRACRSPLHARNVVREYLQARILAALQREGAFLSIAFLGGTSLRFLHQLDRYSEDLDFSLVRPGQTVDLFGWLHAVRSELAPEGYTVALKVSEAGTVRSGFVKVPGLLHALDLSHRMDENVAVKVEIDTSPPPGGVVETTMVRRYVVLNLQHFDRSTLLAGKLHAVLQRPYVKGRDLYDLRWYLADSTWPEPNLLYLNAALEQTGWPGGWLEPGTWRQVVAERLRGLPWDRVAADVAPFLERPEASDQLRLDSLLKVLAR